jgi:hypothetical protein
MEDRETIEVETPLKKHQVVLKSWINGREKQKIDGALFKGMETSSDQDKPTPKLNDSFLANQTNAAIQNIVVSVDGNSTNVLDRVLDMRAQDYEFVKDEVNKIVEGDLDEKKESSSETNTSEVSDLVQEQSPTDDSL